MLIKPLKRSLLTASAMTIMVISPLANAQMMDAQDDMTPMMSQQPAMAESIATTLPVSGGMSLREAIAVGVSTNPEYGVVAASRRATDEEYEQAKALYYPSIDFRGDAGVEYTDSPTTRSGGSNDDTETFGRYDAGLTLTQLLFDGFETRYENYRQDARVMSSAYRVQETLQFVGLAVVEAYLEVMRQRQLLTIARQNVEQHIDILNQIEAGVSGGRSTQADLEQARARFAQAQATEANTKEALRSAEADFREEVGTAPGNLEVPNAPFEAISASVESSVEQALANSPTLDIFESDIEVAYAEAQGTKSTFYPQLDLQVNGRTGDNLSGIEGRNTSASALVVANWNLYRGGGDTARAHEFIHRHQGAKSEREEAERALENDIRQTWASMVAAGERARYFAAQADANTEVVRAYKDQFSLDRRTLLDVLDSQNELFVSRSNTINSEYIEMLAVYRILALRGDLLQTMGVEYPEEAIASYKRWDTDMRMKAR